MTEEKRRPRDLLTSVELALAGALQLGLWGAVQARLLPPWVAVVLVVVGSAAATIAQWRASSRRQREDRALRETLRQNAEELADTKNALEAMRCKGLAQEKLAQSRAAELTRSMKRYRSLVENTNVLLWEYDLAEHKLLYVAPQASKMLGVPPEALERDGLLSFLHPDDVPKITERLRTLDAASPFQGGTIDARFVTPDQRTVYTHSVLSARRAGSPLQIFTIDITKQKQLELELQQAQKLESVGRLAAGVAHEINTPVQFVSDSVYFIQEALQTYVESLSYLKAVEEAVLTDVPAKGKAQVSKDVYDETDLNGLLERVPRALERSLEGLGRITAIVRSMREFAHPDSAQLSNVDLNRAIDSTLTIARGEYKQVADVETDFGDIPMVICQGGEVNQAVLNILVNAAHAIAERVKDTGEKGKITVRTRRDREDVVVAISDTGSGIPETIRNRIFDPFFTTKEVGKGTGQGLAITRAVIVEKHGGQLSFESEVGKGTTFTLRLPIAGPPKQESRGAIAA